jgi:hypothetical protein
MIPDDIRRFVLTSIPSIPYLEAALLFRRDPTSEWSARSVSRALYISEATDAELIQAPLSAAIITARGDPSLFQCSPRDATLDQLLGRLAEIYRTDMIGVTQLVHDATRSFSS